MSSLADSFDALYSAFRNVPKPTKIDGCPCCLDEDEICTLLSKPLRELTGGELSSYSSSAFLTVGEQADYLFFLPRILEVACVEWGRWWPDVEVTGRAIGKTTPSGWPECRRTALLEVLHAVLQEAIDDDEGWTIDDLICAIGKMGVEVAPFLRQVETSTSAVLAYYDRNSQALSKPKLANAFWDKTDPGYDEVIDWFKCPRVSRLILEGYDLTTENGPQALPPNA